MDASLQGITPHQVLVYLHLKRVDRWVTAIEVARTADLKGRTVRHHLAALAEAGVAERVECFGGYRYRLAEPKDMAARDVLGRLAAAAEVFSTAAA